MRLKSLKKNYPLFIWVFLLALLFFRYAEPIKDGDIFFHMKYGEYHIQNRTMLADHSLFSWTPATKYMPYCTWAADIIFFLLYKLGGWPLLYLVKYIGLLSPIMAIVYFSRKLKLATEPITLFSVLMVIFAIVDAAYIKPELISFVFFAIISSLYFYLKLNHKNKRANLCILIFPLVFIVWANMHGIFVFGLVFYACIIAGELINHLLGGKNAFNRKTILLLLAAGPVSLAVTLLTPYGLDYYNTIIHLSTHGVAAKIVKSIMSYQSILGKISQNDAQHNFEYWGIMTVLFLVFFIMNSVKNRDYDFGILVPTLFLSAIGLRYQRSTFYWPTFWALSILYFSSKDRFDLKIEIKKLRPLIRNLTVALLACISVFIITRGIYDTLCRPGRWLYFGFGYSYILPYQESAFLKKNNIQGKLFNSYNTGSYLLFNHYPERKVFIDARYFPYQDNVFNKYMAFRDGEMTLKEMEAEYGFDVALMEHSTSMLRWFFSSSRWRPVYYGLSSVVFVKTESPYHSDIKNLDIHRFDSVKNLLQAADIVVSAQNMGDFTVASYVIYLMQKKMSHMAGFDFFYHYCLSSQKGLLAYKNGDYEKAFKNLIGIAGRNYSNLNVIKAIKKLVDYKLDVYLNKNQYDKALDMMILMKEYFPNDPDIIYNTGAIQYVALSHGGLRLSRLSVDSWKVIFEQLITKEPDYTHANIIKKLLSGEKVTEQLPIAHDFLKVIDQE